MEEPQILYLEPDEEIPAILDRLNEIKDASITLVVPKASVVLQSVINLKLLLRVEQKNNLKIAIVCQDNIGRNLAAQVGIPVYGSIDSKTPLFEPKPRLPEKEETIEVNLDSSKPSVPVHHFQEETKPAENEKETSQDQPKTEGALPAPETAASSLPIREIVAPPAPKRKKNKGWLVSVVTTLTVITIGVYVFFPKGLITVKVNGEDFAGEQEITVSTAEKNINFQTAVIPGQKVEVSQDITKQFSATGKKNVGEKAKGTVNLFNSWSTDAVALASGSKLVKDGKVFLTTQDVSIPGASLTLKEGQVVTNPGKASGQIEASEAGDSYNVSAGRYTIAELPADKKEKIYGEGEKALTGGSNKEITVVSGVDIESAKETVREDASVQAKDELTSQAKGMVVLDKSIRAETSEVKPSVAEGTQANEFTLQAKVKTRAIAFNEASFRSLFLDKINKKVPSGKELIAGEGVNSGIDVTVKNSDPEKGELVVLGSIKTKVSPKLNLLDIKSTAAGKPIVQVEETLKTQKDIQGSKVTVRPNWLFNRLPFSSSQIEIKIEYL